MKMFLKKGFSSFLSMAGLFPVMDRLRLRNKAFILMYHRIVDSGDVRNLYIEPGMYVTRDSFEMQISFLKSRYSILCLEELIENVQNNRCIGSCCSITFDDGWLDNYTNAFPILEKYQAPATIFLATAFIGTNRLFWPDEFCLYFKRERFLQLQHEDRSSPIYKFYIDSNKYASFDDNRFLNHMIVILKGYSPDDRDSIIKYFRSEGEFQDIPRQMLNWQEVNQMAKSGLISFGAHTVKHEILDQISIRLARSEISQSKRDIEKKTSLNVASFAYPNGNYNKDIRKEIENNDYICAVTTKKGFLCLKTSLFEIPRIGIHEDISNTLPMFWGRIILEKF